MLSRLLVKTYLLILAISLLFSSSIYFIIIPLVKENSYASESRVGLSTLNNAITIALAFKQELESYRQDVTHRYTDKNLINTLIDKKYAMLAESLRTFLINNKIGENGHVYIFDSNNNIVLHPNIFLDGTDISNLMLKNDRGSFATELKKKAFTTHTLKYTWDKNKDPGNYIYDKISWVKYSKELDMYFSTSSYMYDINKYANQISTKIQIISFVLLIISLILGYIFINKFLQPLKILKNTVKKIDEGELNARSNLVGKDELSLLAKAFDKMATKVEYTIDSLDEKVKDKTLYLQQIFDTQVNIFFTTDGKDIKEANKRFFDLFTKFETINDFKAENNCICDFFIEDSNNTYLAAEIDGNTWVEYVYNNPNESHKAKISQNSIIYIFKISVARINVKNKAIFLVNMTNITELEHLNNNLVQTVEDEVEKNRKKDKQLLEQSRLAQMGEMLSMIAHQWRQPLAAISSTSAGLELKASLRDLDKETIIKFAKDISRYSQHLSSTINDFRDFFKPEKAQQETSYVEIIKSVLNMVGVSIKNKNIKIIEEYNIETEFKTHSNELKQVILNLIKNAEDILQENKTEDAYIKIKTYLYKGKPILEISDNGGGIPKSIMKKIFNPYFSTKLEKNGTGLGLYMSKMIIEEHCEGTLSVHNDKDGAVFQISI